MAKTSNHSRGRGSNYPLPIMLLIFKMSFTYQIKLFGWSYYSIPMQANKSYKQNLPLDRDYWKCNTTRLYRAYSQTHYKYLYTHNTTLVQVHKKQKHIIVFLWSKMGCIQSKNDYSNMSSKKGKKRKPEDPADLDNTMHDGIQPRPPLIHRYSVN